MTIKQRIAEITEDLGAIRILGKFWLPYSLFYFALRIWRRNIDFLHAIENNFLLLEILMFFMTCLLFRINLKFQAAPKDRIYTHACFILILVVANSIYHNVYAYLMRPFVGYFPFTVSYLISYVAIGMVASSLSFLLMKVVNSLYEKYRSRR